jgi:hypothetical protein
MLITILKALGTAVFVVFMSEVAKRSSVLAAIVVALPLMTMLIVANTALGGDIDKANQFNNSTFLLFWPGLAFFIVLPVAQKLGAPFWAAFALAIVITGLSSWGFIALYKVLGVKL